MTAESFAQFCCCNFWHQLKPLTIPEAIRHPTRETQVHRVTRTHSAAANVMTAESFAHFRCCNFWHQLKSLTIPQAIRHPTRKTHEHRVTSTHSAAAPSAYGSFCRMCDFLGRMVILKKRLRSNFCAAAWCGSRGGEASLF